LVRIEREMKLFGRKLAQAYLWRDEVNRGLPELPALYRLGRRADGALIDLPGVKGATIPCGG
jgi:hypothetical protein